MARPRKRTAATIRETVNRFVRCDTRDARRVHLGSMVTFQAPVHALTTVDVVRAELEGEMRLQQQHLYARVIEKLLQLARRNERHEPAMVAAVAAVQEMAMRDSQEEKDKA